MSIYYHKTVYELNEDGMTLVESHPYEWDGPVALCKKGREQQQQITDAQIKQMQQQAQMQQMEQAAADRTIGTFETEGKPGQLSPAAAAQLASDNDNIARTYNGMRKSAFANMGSRGFGNAPSGFTLAAINGINQGQAEAGTGAFRNAQINTQNLLDRALNARMEFSKQNLAGTNQAANTASEAAYRQSQMGSTLGDIGKGISAGAGIAGSIAGLFKPGLMTSWNGQSLTNLPLSPSGKALTPGIFSKMGTYGG